MKNSPECSTSKMQRALNLLAAGGAFLFIGFASSSCTCRHQVGAAVAHSPGVAVGYDLPYDYLSARYRQLYRSDPDWFHRHYEQDYYRSPAGK